MAYPRGLVPVPHITTKKKNEFSWMTFQHNKYLFRCILSYMTDVITAGIFLQLIGSRRILAGQTEEAKVWLRALDQSRSSWRQTRLD